MKTVVVILLATLASAAFTNAQDQRNDRKHSLTVEIPNLLLKTISISYNYKLNSKYELRINPKISFDGPKDNLVAGLKLVKDPFWYYNSYTLQVGLSRNFNRVYLEPMLFYKYASFDDRSLQITDPDGDSYDVYQQLSRQYNSGGIVLRSGLKVDKDHFRFNFFYGMGYYLRYYHEVITAEHAWAGGLFPTDYPIVSDYWKDGLSLHVGFEIGYRFGTTDEERK